MMVVVAIRPESIPTRQARKICACILAALGFLLDAGQAKGFTIDFDSTPQFTSYPIYSSSGITHATADVEPIQPDLPPFSTPPYALWLNGQPATTSASVYFRVFADLNLPITSSTFLSYSIAPTNESGKYVAVDLVLESPGGQLSNLRSYPSVVDQFGVSLHPTAQGTAGLLPLNRYTTIRSAIGDHLRGYKIKHVLVGFERSTSAGGLFSAILDDIRIDSSRYVWINGITVDADDDPYSHPSASIVPQGGGSTCGPDANAQLARTCDPALTSHVARVRVSSGSTKIYTRIPENMDVLVSVCSGNIEHGIEDLYACDQTDPHPSNSYCRPFQSKTKARLQVRLPSDIPPASISIAWKYVPDGAFGTLPGCDEAGFAKVVSTASSPAGPAGDLNDDDFVNHTDGVNALRCAADLPSPHCDRADVDCDNSITPTDAVKILRVSAGLDHILLPCFFCGMYSTGASAAGVQAMGEFSSVITEYSGSQWFHAYAPLFASHAPRTAAFLYLNYKDYANSLNKAVKNLTISEINAYTHQELTRPEVAQNKQRIAGIYVFDEPEISDFPESKLKAAIDAVNLEMPGVPTLIAYTPNGGESPEGLTYRAFSLYAKTYKNLSNLQGRLNQEMSKANGAKLIAIPRMWDDVEPLCCGCQYGSWDDLEIAAYNAALLPALRDSGIVSGVLGFVWTSFAEAFTNDSCSDGPTTNVGLEGLQASQDAVRQFCTAN